MTDSDNLDLLKDWKKFSTSYEKIGYQGWGTTCVMRVWAGGTAIQGDGKLEELAKKVAELESRKVSKARPIAKGTGGIRMILYKVFVVDTKKLEIVSEQTVFGESEADAMSDVVLDDTAKALKKRERLAILTMEIGEFERFKVTHIQAEEEDD